MNSGKKLRLLLLTAFSLVLAGCSGGGGSGGANSISTAIQDLTVDPDGTTTVITFASTKGLAASTVANFEATGGQTAQSVSVNGDEVTVEWDARVSPSHQVRASALSGVSSTFHAVTTSDSTAPTFTVTAATQNPNLGGDTIALAFSGPRVIESEIEDATNWTLETDGQTLDLTGSTFVLNVGAQTVAVTLGTLANLHADFSLTCSGAHSVADVDVDATPVDGAATGDSTAPTLVSANQNLTEDEYGRVVDFTFSEAMDPVFSTQLSHFSVSLPDVATTVEQPSEDVLRVTFNAPMVPGVDEVMLQDLVDLHGNPFPDTLQAIAQPSPVANAFDGDVLAVTVANAGGDYVQAVTTQAFDPESALDPSNWDLIVDGVPVDLTFQTFSYDLLTKTLRIDLDIDLVNGDAFTLTSLSVLDVDGQSSGLADTRTVAGETTAPTISFARQNRNEDPSGATVDVTMNEDVEPVTAEALTSWSSSGPQTLLSATLQPGQRVIRLVFDDLMLPGDFTLAAQDVKDLAGNAMTPAAGVALTSTDTTPPGVLTFSGTAHEGANNDVVELIFDDDLVVADITDPSKWTLESPTGTPRSTTGANVEWVVNARRARLQLANGVNLRRDDDFRVVLNGVRDFGGNVASASPHTGAVQAETTLPYVHTVWLPTAATDALEVRFSEPCGELDDLYHPANNPDGTRYVLRDWLGLLVGYATNAVPLDDGLGVRVSFGIVVDPTDTIDVIGPTDLVGNPLFPALAVPSVAEDLNEPGLDPGQTEFTSVSGEDNDTITVRFDRPMSPWLVADHVNYTPTGPTDVEKRSLDVTFDGVDTVTLPTVSNNNDADLRTGEGYDLTVADLRSAQGVPMSLPFTETGIVVTGDVVTPGVQAGKVRIDPQNANALLVEFREAIAPNSATNVANYDYNSGTPPLSVQRLGERVVRLVFAAPPQVGLNLALTVEDRAGNSSGLVTRAITAADATGPLVTSVTGVIEPGYGGDEVRIAYDEPVTGATSTNLANYTIQSGASPRSLVGASATYSSVSNQVTIRLAPGQDLAAASAVTVGVSGIRDFSGNQMAAALQVGGATSGDSVAPAFSGAFVNLRANPNGRVVDVLFSEDVDATFASNVANWTATGGPSVVSVVLRERDHFRVTLSAVLPPSGTLAMNGVPDVAGNVSGALSVDPVE